MSKIMPCRVCKEPVVVSNGSYLEHIKRGSYPVCRKNGCERLCGRHVVDIARTSEVQLIRGLAGAALVVGRPSDGEPVPPLAKWRITRCVTGDSEIGGAAGERYEK